MTFATLIGVQVVAVAQDAATGKAEKPSAVEEPEIVEVTPATAGLGDTITLRIKNWPKQSQESDIDLKRWALRINDMVIPGMLPVCIGVDRDTQQARLTFHLKRHAENKELWNQLLRKESQQDFQWERSVAIGVAAEKDFVAIQPYADEKGFQLIVIPKRRFMILLVAFVVVLLLLIWLGHTSNILKSSEGVYSLGRTQMAWWFAIILGSYLYLGVLTQDWTTTVQPSALVLLGISSATALGAKLISDDKAKQVENAKKNIVALQANVVAVQRQIAAPASPSALSVASAQLPQLQNQLNAASAAVAKPAKQAKQFFRDLVSDADGVSIHRFQNLIWTIAFGGVYLLTVPFTLEMPEFNTTMLTLMGISSGSYVAFKAQET